MLERQILALLAEYAERSVDYAAIFTLLNTAAGGHYEERFTETEILAALESLLRQGAIEVRNEAGALLTDLAPGPPPRTFHLTVPGRTGMNEH